MLTLEQISRMEEIACEAARTADPAHDFGHVRRVAASARHIAEAEGADRDVVVPAALLHELFSYPKDYPESPHSGEVCAERAAVVLFQEGYREDLVALICECIRIHPFSGGIVPETKEAKVLQDADRLDALGSIGIARCFAVGSTLGLPFYDPDDPFCRRREPEDKKWTLDHFYRKLLRLPGTMHTETARTMARERTAFIELFLAQLEREVGGQMVQPMIEVVQVHVAPPAVNAGGISLTTL